MYGAPSPALDIDGYLELDVRIGWSPSRDLELAVVGQNLLDDRHPEFTPDFIRASQVDVPRSVYAKSRDGFNPGAGRWL